MSRTKQQARIMADILRQEERNRWTRRSTLYERVWDRAHQGAARAAKGGEA